MAVLFINAGGTLVFRIRTTSYSGFSWRMLLWTGGLNLSNFKLFPALQLGLTYTFGKY